MKILFICTGNTCRSPMAEGVFRDLLKKDENEEYMCQSAGIATANGIAVEENAVLACKEVDIDISTHESRTFQSNEIHIWDAYFVVSTTHGYILEQAGVPKEKIYVSSYIEDPFGCDLDTYRNCLVKITEEVTTFYAKLKILRANQI